METGRPLEDRFEACIMQWDDWEIGKYAINSGRSINGGKSWAGEI
jgi:hypothetical protein